MILVSESKKCMNQPGRRGGCDDVGWFAYLVRGLVCRLVGVSIVCMFVCNAWQYTSVFRQMETEVISMTAAMLNGDDDTVGFLTSGGTESILMAVKTYRDRAKKLYPHIKNPEIVRNHLILSPFHYVILSFFLSVCLSVCLPACLPACLPVCLSVCLSFLLSFFLLFLLVSVFMWVFFFLYNFNLCVSFWNHLLFSFISSNSGKK